VEVSNVYILVEKVKSKSMFVRADREISNSDPELLALYKEDKQYKKNVHHYTKEQALCSGHYNLAEHQTTFGNFSFTVEGKNDPLEFIPPKKSVTRLELLIKLKEQGFSGWAAELGVANGEHAREILSKASFSRVFAIDAWAGKAIKRRKSAIRNLSSRENSAACIIWTYFEQAVELFPDRSFDYIYVDGFAGDGELDGATFELFLPKVKPGGVLAGHDYDKRWPKVIRAVTDFAAKNDLVVHTMPHSDQRWDRFTSWFVVVPNGFLPEIHNVEQTFVESSNIEESDVNIKKKYIRAMVCVTISRQ
jgi:hypothetical protein